MKKLFSCLYGSRLYGTQTPTSDLDLKHVFLPELNDLLIGKQLANKVKKTNTAKNTRNGADDVDEEFLPVQVFARDFMMGQTYALELAFAVEGTHAGQTLWTFNPDLDIEQEAYVPSHKGGHSSMRGEHLFLEFVRELREKFLTSNIKALMGYAVNQASLYSFKGERLNAAREVLSVLQELELADDSKHPSNFERLSFHSQDARWASLAAKYPKYFKITEYDIGDGQMRPCFMLLEKVLPHTNDLRMSVKVVKNLVDKYGSRADAASADNVDWKATMHALRIVDEGLLLLEQHRLQFPFDQPYVDRLLSIKRGEVPLDEVKAELDEKLEKLKTLEQTTTLEPASRERTEEFEEWLARWMRKFYGV